MGEVQPTSDAQCRQLAFKLNPCLQVVVCSSDEVLIKHGGWSRHSALLYDEGRTGTLSQLFSALHDGCRTVGDLVERVPLASHSELAETVQTLLADRILVANGVGPAEGWAGLMYPDGPARPDARLSLIGDGPVGTELAGHLTKLGVEFEMADPNLHDRVEAAVAGSDMSLVVPPSWSPVLLHTVNRTAIAHRKPWVTGYCDGSVAIAGPFFVPGATACYAEFETQLYAVSALPVDHRVYRSSQQGKRPSPAWLYGVITSWLMVSIVAYVWDGRAPLGGKAVITDFEKLTTEAVRVLRLPGCPACQTALPPSAIPRNDDR